MRTAFSHVRHTGSTPLNSDHSPSNLQSLSHLKSLRRRDHLMSHRRLASRVVAGISHFEHLSQLTGVVIEDKRGDQDIPGHSVLPGLVQHRIRVLRGRVGLPCCAETVGLGGCVSGVSNLSYMLLGNSAKVMWWLCADVVIRSTRSDGASIWNSTYDGPEYKVPTEILSILVVGRRAEKLRVVASHGIVLGVCFE